MKIEKDFLVHSLLSSRKVQPCESGDIGRGKLLLGKKSDIILEELNEVLVA